MRTPFLAGVLTLSIVGAARADVSIDYAIDGDCAMEPSGMKVSGSRLRVDTRSGGGDGSGLFDGMEDMATYLDHERRTFNEMEVDLDAADYMGDVAKSSVHFVDREMEKMQAQMKDACEQMQKQGMDCPQLMSMDPRALAEMAQAMGGNASPEAAEALAARGGAIDAQALEGMRAQLQDPMGDGAHTEGRGDPRKLAGALPSALPDFIDTGRDDTIDGASCRWFEQRAGEVVLQSQCVAAVEALDIPDRDRAGLQRAMGVMQRFAAAFQPWMQRYGIDQAGPPSNRGLILAQQCNDARGREIGSARAVIAQGAIDDDLFEVPAGYSRQRMDGAE
jgi:hypothetical protein